MHAHSFVVTVISSGMVGIKRSGWMSNLVGVYIRRGSSDDKEDSHTIRLVEFKILKIDKPPFHKVPREIRSCHDASSSFTAFILDCLWGSELRVDRTKPCPQEPESMEA